MAASADFAFDGSELISGRNPYTDQRVSRLTAFENGIFAIGGPMDSVLRDTATTVARFSVMRFFTKGSQVAAHGAEDIVFGTNLPAKSLDNVAAREWYHKQLEDIPNRIDKSLSLRDQALQAFKMRNVIKLQARELMSDQKLASKLKIEEPLKTLKGITKKAYDRNYVGNQLWEYIRNGSIRSNIEVDQVLGLIRDSQEFTP